MVHHLFVVLHGGHGGELTLFGYLFGVALHLLAFGAVAALVLGSSKAVGAVRHALSS